MDHDNIQKSIDDLGKNITDIVTTAIKVADVRISRTDSLDFVADEKTSIYGKGLFWKGQGPTRQFIYRPDPERLWSSQSIDLQDESFYAIGNTPVLRLEELGSSVTKSSLTQVGTLHNLRTSGDISIDDYVFYNSGHNRLGIGTEDPNGALSVTSLDAEFIIEPDGPQTRVGTYTNDDLVFITDDTDRLTIRASGNIELGHSEGFSKVTVHGTLGIGVKNLPEDTSLAVDGPIRFQNKRFEVSDSQPRTGNYNKGDIVWNDNPQPTGYVGWICIRSGTPGTWKGFGQISG